MIRGKGNKLRRCPLWPQTVSEVVLLTQARDPATHVFLNRRGQPITRFGIHTLVERYAQRAAVTMPSLKKKRVSPHSLRHTAATHLLRAGVDINTIRGWLGHVSINTTNIYAETDLEMKAQALALCEVRKTKTARHWRDDRNLMSFLQTL
jgi:integrase/recombinase XerD